MANETFRVVEFIGVQGKVFRCQDAGLDCQFAVQSPSEEQIIKSLLTHVKRDSYMSASPHFNPPGGLKMDTGEEAIEKPDSPTEFAEKAKALIQPAVHRVKVTALADDLYVFDPKDKIEGVDAKGRKVVCVKRTNGIGFFETVIAEQERLKSAKTYVFAVDLEQAIRDKEITGALHRSDALADIERRVSALEREIETIKTMDDLRSKHKK